jgi:hypothetical protein
MYTREELFQRILIAARSIDNAAVLHKGIQADGGYFEKLS